MSKSLVHRPPSPATGSVALLAFLPALAWAQTWDGGGSDNNLGTPDNWVSNLAPGKTADANLVFAGSTRLAPHANGGNWEVNSVVFDFTAGAFTLGGGGLHIDAGGITNNSASTQTIGNQIRLDANQTWTAATGDLVINGYVGGNRELTLDGAGAFTVNNQLNGLARLNVQGSGDRTINDYVSAGTIELGGSGSTTFGSSSAFNAGSGGVIITGDGDVDFSGAINSGAITLNGTGTTTLGGGASKSTGAVTVNSGTLVLAQTGGGDALNNSLTVTDGGSVVFAGDNQIPEWQSVTLGDGATLYLGETSQTFAELVLTGDAIIDFGSGGADLNITYGGITFGEDATLTVLNWNGAVDFFSATVNPAGDLPRVIFDGYGEAVWNPSGGAIVPGAPVPEPRATGLLVGVGLAALAGCRRRRRPAVTPQRA